MCPLSREEMRKIPVLKNKTQGNYVNVYKGIVFDKGLSLKDRGMLLTLLSLGIYRCRIGKDTTGRKGRY